MSDEIAERGRWNTQALPQLRASLPLLRRFNAEETTRLRRGLVPRDVEDKWFICCDEDQLLLYRAWTGICIYGATLRPDPNGCTLVSPWVNREPSQYAQSDLDWDSALASWLIERLLLGRELPFPARKGLSPDKAHAFEHTVVGRGRVAGS